MYKVENGKLVRIPNSQAPPKPRVGRKPLPSGEKREQYTVRLHPDSIDAIKKLKEAQNTPASRIVENLILKESDRLGL